MFILCGGNPPRVGLVTLLPVEMNGRLDFATNDKQNAVIVLIANYSQ
ncbi:hypothetical protein BMS3Bbin14_01743 [bacterium BMS3Bbin14]|nr:hypothetical protein BMS3Bbin14_01743 [bacterium BMS3Bbin14]